MRGSCQAAALVLKDCNERTRGKRSAVEYAAYTFDAARHYENAAEQCRIECNADLSHWKYIWSIANIVMQICKIQAVLTSYQDSCGPVMLRLVAAYVSASAPAAADWLTIGPLTLCTHMLRTTSRVI
jgi:hypothetical protein